MPAPSLCIVSGVVYDENGAPAVGVTLYLTKVLLNGVLIGTAPIGSASIPGPSDHTVFYIEAITSDAVGAVSFTVPQLSTVYLEGNVSGYNNGEVALSIPATATATLESLTPATFPIDVTTFTFLSLVDTPDDFTGDALKIVRVNAAGTALEFSAPVVVDNETVQDALSAFFPDVAPFDWTYDDAGDRVTLAILDATSAARGLMSTAYAARLDQLEVGDAPTFAGLTLSGLTQGSIPFAGAGGVISQDNAGLFWDDTNNRLGVGVANPSAFVVLADDNSNSWTFHRTNRRLGQFFAAEANPRWALGTTQPNLRFNTSGATSEDVNGSGVGCPATRSLGLYTSNATNLIERLRIDGAGLVGVNILSSIAAQLHTLSNAIGVIPFIAEGPAGQTANLQEWRVNGSAVCTLASTGSISTTGSLITTGNSIVGRSSLVAFNSTTNFALANTFVMAWNAAATYNGGAFDTSLSRQGAGVVQVGDGTANANGKMRAAEYQVAAIKVLGAQGAAVIDATDNPSAITQLNALLARLRAHGLIAT